MTTEHCKLV